MLARGLGPAHAASGGAVTEQTAAGSEEMASSSEELGAQASALRDVVARFRIDGTSRMRTTAAGANGTA